MKIHENYIYLLDGKKEVKVLWKKLDKVCVMEIGKEYPSAIVDVDRLSGIQLTEEWLEKFGFEIEDDYLELVINERLSIIWVGYLAIMIEGNINFLNTDKVFIHQLQNVFHSLTNQEL